jgi:hypothetical protein
MGHEGRLDGVEPPLEIPDPLNRDDVPPSTPDRQGQTGAHEDPVDKDTAGPADPHIARPLGPRHPQVFPKDIDQGAMGGNQDLNGMSVQREFDALPDGHT